ncbi:MAG TPA: GNVR domain-containing protein [Anaeromyxobacteraceae bacterium]|nr:GNVR domain-containing protein [Anaeromyxobacteraceae bacterium]
MQGHPEPAAPAWSALGGNVARSFPPPRGPSSGDGLEPIVSRAREVIRRRWKEALAVAAATFLLTQALAFFWPGTFAAQARLLIQKPRASVTLTGDVGQAPTVVSAGVTEEEVNSEIAILTSQEVLEATVAATGLERAPTPWYARVLLAPVRWYDSLYARYQGVPEATPAQRAVQSLVRCISAERMKASNIITVTLEARDPDGAAALLGELLKQYLRWHIDVLGRDQMIPLLSGQAGVMEGKLAQVEEALQKGKREGGTIDPGLERDVQLKIDAALREEAEALLRRKAELDGKLRAFAWAQSQPMKGREARLALDNDRTTAMVERAGLAARMKILDEQIVASRERLLDLDRRAIDVTRNQRHVRALEERYLAYLSRSEQARIDSALDQNRVTNVSVVQAAAASTKPLRPKRPIVLVVSIAGGLLAGVLWAAARELRAMGLTRVLESVAPTRS